VAAILRRSAIPFKSQKEAQMIGYVKVALIKNHRKDGDSY
jgi:hypothetical protein